MNDEYQMELYAKIVNGFMSLNIYGNSSFLEVRQSLFNSQIFNWAIVLFGESLIADFPNINSLS